jgi:uncharacterized membrane protein
LSAFASPPPENRILLLLFVLITIYFLVSFTLSGFRYLDFTTSNFDLGIFQQAFWTAGHGGGLFSSGVFELTGHTSLIAGHPVPALYALAFLYGLSPSPWTLFALQSAVVALAAVPLFFLARDVTRSDRRALVVGAAYLLWAPLLASNLFDFHLDAFAPIELFGFFFAWNRRYYGAGAMLALLAVVSFEANSAFLFLTAMFFALPTIRELRSPRGGRNEGASSTGVLRRSLSVVGRWIRQPRVAASLALAAAAVLAYVLLIDWESIASGVSVPGIGNPTPSSLLAGGPPALKLGLDQLAPGFLQKAAYWIVAYALLGFAPLRVPRTYILQLPWVAATLFAPATVTTFAFESALVAAYPIFVGFAFGLRAIPSSFALARLDDPVKQTYRSMGRWRAWLPLPRGRVTVGLMILAANLLLSPVNPLLQTTSQGGGYAVSYQPAPGFAQVQQLIQLLPADASVLASDNLFPLVANDANAYGLLYAPFPPIFLPFGPKAPPSYVLLAENEIFGVPPWLVTLLGNGSIYGLRGSVGQTPAGFVALYEEGFSGPALQLSPPTFAGATYSWPDLRVGQASELSSDPAVHWPYVIGSIPGAVGNLWYGPYVPVPPGAYRATVSVRLSLAPGVTPPNASQGVLKLDAVGFPALQFGNTTVLWGNVTSGSWLRLTLTLAVPESAMRLEVRGFLLSGAISAEVGEVELDPVFS